MAVNHYFQHGFGIGDKSEQDLLHQLNAEVIQMAGFDILYLPRSIVSLDELFHEDYLSSFVEDYTIECFLENYDQYLGGGDLIGKFGFQSEDQIRIVIAKQRFLAVVGKEYPNEGDLVYMPETNDLFEVKYVDYRVPIIPLGDRYYFTLICEQFKYSHELIVSRDEALNTVNLQYGNDGATGIGATGPLDPYGKNKEIKEISDSIIDFSEKNPFSGF